MSTICRDCEAIVVAGDDVPANLVKIAMANHKRFCKPGRHEICDICDDVDSLTSLGETNIHAVLTRLTGFRSPTPGALAQHLTRHNRHDLTARLPGLHAAKPIATPSTQPEKKMTLQSVPEGRPATASLIDHDDKRIARAAQKVMAAEAALDAAWEANAEKAALRAKRDRLKKQLAEIEAQIKGTAPAPAPGVDLNKVRAWAAEQGYEVAASGRIPKAIMADYLDATSGGAA
ncbi:MAG: Lsr2 family protein [bacterium]|nr:Lsr2 family protein [bacterium]